MTKKRCIKYDELGRCIEWSITDDGYLEGKLLKSCPLKEVEEAVNKGKVKLKIPIEPPTDEE